MKRILVPLLALILLFSVPALFAGTETKTLYWDNPTTWGSGAPMSAADQLLLVNRIYESADGGANWTEVGKIGPAKISWSGTLTHGRLYGCDASVTDNGALSAKATYFFQYPQPGAPGRLRDAP